MLKALTGGAAPPPYEIARMLLDFHHYWLIQSGLAFFTGGTKKILDFDHFWPLWRHIVNWWRHRTFIERKQRTAIESLIIVAQESSTYQNDRIDVRSLTNMQIMAYGVIFTSLWRHFRVWDHKWRHCDVIFCRKNLKKFMEIAEIKSFISYAGFFLLSLLEKKLQRF